MFGAGAGWAAQHFLTVNRSEIETAAGEQPNKPTTEKAERTDRDGDPLPPGRHCGWHVLFRNRAGIGQIVYSPDGKLLAAGAGREGGNIFLYDAATGRTLRQLQGFANQLSAPGLRTGRQDPGLCRFPNRPDLDVATGQCFTIVIKSDKHSDYDFLITVPLLFSHDGKALAWCWGTIPSMSGIPKPARS